MQEIESMSGSQSLNVSDVECLWIEEWSGSENRDNIPLDPDICVSTVLNFPYDRSIADELAPVNKIEPDIVGKRVEACL